MSVDFTKVKIEINGQSLNGLIKRGLDISPGKVKCTSHCQVEIDAMDYTVIWEFSNCQAADQHEATAQVAPVSNNNPSPDSDESYESDTEIQYSLPFKVLGTCHSSYRQDALEEAYSCLNEYNRPVFVKLEHEEDNTYDSNAIAVFVQVDYEYKKVGYIASELTKFVHPHLTNPSFDVSVKHIRFCTNFWMVGYYITIELSKKGLWNKEVLKASKRVK